MTVFSAFIFISLAVVTVSLAWGIRGDLIGGEEGAMLPGAFLGLTVSCFLDESLMIFSALGMIGMFFGGTQTYAQTLEFSYWGDGHNPKAPNMKKALIGLSLKGAPWFGIVAAVIGVGYTAMTVKYYSFIELAVLVISLPIVRSLGIRLLNTPYFPTRGIFPRFYFSKNRREEWGGLWFMLLDFIAFTLSQGDFFTFKLILFGIFGGSVGWIIAQLLHAATRVKMKNGKYFFGKFQSDGKIDNWKLMEFCYGALGALSVSLGIAISGETVKEYTALLDTNGEIWRPITNVIGYDLSAIAPALWLVLLLIDSLRNIIPASDTASYKRYKKLAELIHRPVLTYIPLLFILYGSVETAKLTAVTLLWWLASEELAFVQLKDRGFKYKAAAAWAYLSTSAITVAVLIKPEIFTPIVYFTLMSVHYIINTSISSIAHYKHLSLQAGDKKLKLSALIKSNPTFISVKSHYIVCLIIAFLIILIQ